MEHTLKFFRFSVVVYLVHLSFITTIYGQSKKGDVKIEIEQFHPKLEELINLQAEVEILGEGFDWTEGPLWIEEHQKLLFSDIPSNSIFQWTSTDGIELYLKPSGYTGQQTRGGETGSNGLLLDPDGNLVLCQHGDRRMAIMEAPLEKPSADFKSIADNFQGKKFNSPNDAVYRENGDLYFTDPPYGLEKNIKDPLKELPFQGVYKVNRQGKVILLLDSLTRPNGIAFLPGEKTVVIANSDPAKPYWYAYDLDNEGMLANGKIFYDATEASKVDKGMPDGLKVDKNGTVYATGPGGIWIFSEEGEALGRIKVNHLTSNCALADHDQTLYVTADDFLLKINLK
jgi:gluconolactonase